MFTCNKLKQTRCDPPHCAVPAWHQNSRWTYRAIIWGSLCVFTGITCGKNATTKKISKCIIVSHDGISSYLYVL